MSQVYRYFYTSLSKHNLSYTKYVAYCAIYVLYMELLKFRWQVVHGRW